MYISMFASTCADRCRDLYRHVFRHLYRDLYREFYPKLNPKLCQKVFTKPYSLSYLLFYDFKYRLLYALFYADLSSQPQGREWPLGRPLPGKTVSRPCPTTTYSFQATARGRLAARASARFTHLSAPRPKTDGCEGTMLRFILFRVLVAINTGFGV